MMAVKKKTARAPANKPQPVSTLAPEDRAKIALQPTIHAAAVIEVMGKSGFGELDISQVAENLRENLRAINANDMTRCEAMLFSQANALQSIFTSMARRATNQEYLKQFQCYMSMAFKAQNQCRMTLETLSLIKNPPVFAKQANIAHGPQQVNNGTPPSALARAEDSQSAQNKLLTTTPATTPISEVKSTIIDSKALNVTHDS